MSGSSQGGEGSAWVTGVLAEGGNRHARVDPNDSLGLRVPLDIGGAVTGGVDVAVEDLDAHHQRAKAAVPRSCRNSPMTATGAAAASATRTVLSCGYRCVTDSIPLVAR
jgi:hypothetical protein